ncbi:MAG: hypothetical protein QMD94_00990 [Candidatus Omnitrophota bacterium]|nr:hypothetical protein [Candidatus Omnitrophota bacterium]
MPKVIADHTYGGSRQRREGNFLVREQSSVGFIERKSMFIHAVLFEIKPKEAISYRKDSLMWASYAKKAEGFLAYHTMKRSGYKNQYASVYTWKLRRNHISFMKNLHDWLVSKSKARVKVLGYYNFSAIDKYL